MTTSAQAASAQAAASQPPLPTNIPDYLEHLRRSLVGADPALIQDALYDAEEYLRSELAENPGMSEAEVIAQVASSYGAPDEVAEIYRETEVKVQKALQPPKPREYRSLFGRFFGVIAEPRTYAALFYMLLSLVTGIFYFTWAVTGISLSVGLGVLIIGVPFVILFFGSVRMFSLLEGRIVEVMLGERMPRRPLYSSRGKPWTARIGEMFSDPRTWTTLLYMLLMLPLGIAYFTVAVTLLSVSLALALTPLMVLFGFAQFNSDFDGWIWLGFVDGMSGVPFGGPLMLVLTGVIGVVLLFLTLHLARAIGYLHGQFAKHLLVKTAQYS